MEGGIAIFLFLLIVGGAGIGGFLLFGTGGYLRRKQTEGELDDAGDGSRPTHLRVSDETDATFHVAPRAGPGEKSPPPPE